MSRVGFSSFLPSFTELFIDCGQLVLTNASARNIHHFLWWQSISTSDEPVTDALLFLSLHLFGLFVFCLFFRFTEFLLSFLFRLVGSRPADGSRRPSNENETKWKTKTRETEREKTKTKRKMADVIAGSSKSRLGSREPRDTGTAVDPF